MTFLEEFATNLRSARLDKKLTQWDLAQRIGVTANCVSLYETAKRMPSLKMVSIMSNVLDVSLDDLVPCASHDMPDDPCQISIFNLIGEDDA